MPSLPPSSSSFPSPSSSRSSSTPSYTNSRTTPAALDAYGRNNGNSNSNKQTPSSSSPSYSSSRSPTAAKRPANWVPKHDAFIRDQARNGEDAESIRILFEVEYPGVNVSKAWVVERMKATAATTTTTTAAATGLAR